MYNFPHMISEFVLIQQVFTRYCNSFSLKVCGDWWEAGSGEQEYSMKGVVNKHFCPQGIYNLILNKIGPHETVT